MQGTLTFIGGPMDGYRAPVDEDDFVDDELLFFSFDGAKCTYRYRVRLGDLTAHHESTIKIQREEW